jgi:hypothetical protein
MNHLICQIEAIADFAANLVRQDHCDDEEVILVLDALRATEDSLSHQMANQAKPRNVIPFPRPQNPRGIIDIYSCALNGGGWAVEHMSRSGDSAAYLGSFFCITEAVSVARQWAAKLGADFDLGGVA